MILCIRRIANMISTFTVVAFFSCAGIALPGCQKQLFPDSMSPKQLQQQHYNAGTETLPYYDLDDGDNEDPSVDQGAYPNMSEPWWNAPGYIGG